MIPKTDSRAVIELKYKGKGNWPSGNNTKSKHSPKQIDIVRIQKEEVIAKPGVCFLLVFGNLFLIMYKVIGDISPNVIQRLFDVKAFANFKRNKKITSIPRKVIINSNLFILAILITCCLKIR